jgi:GT2 family glycosyltransferase
MLRRKNWKDFLKFEKSILNEKNNSIAILFVTCNSYANIQKCITYLEQESNQDFDIIIVDNSTKCKEIQLIHDL